MTHETASEFLAAWSSNAQILKDTYSETQEHDACGVGIIADMSNAKRHDIIEKGLTILLNLRHRGAVGADPKLGDGCGIMVQIPHRFFVEECAKLGFKLPEPGHYAVGHFFLPQDEEAARLCSG